ncbi:MAG: NADH-quinone oxidoreductase subunit NuoH [Thermoplasmata archaeon]|nr:MAG: NADH-quinone oxidoreductase subunit NuoH [Thermoplasmata archaeon]
MNIWIRGIIGAIFWVALLGISIIILPWLERKVVARVQHRYGPNRVGPFGVLQLLVDAVKLLTKEDIVPADADAFVFNLAPVIGFALAFLPFVVIPFSPSLVTSNLNVGILYILAISSLSASVFLLTGWAPNNKFNLIGGMRAAAMMVAYEIPMALAVIGVVMMAGSLNLVDIVEAQAKVWYVVPQFLGFLIFMVAAFAECGRLPFDLAESESELVQGYTTEYTAMKFAMLLFAEYAHTILAAFLVTILYLGGWNGPFLPAPLWVFIKTFAVIVFFMYMRGVLPRVRVDQFVNIGWKILIPLALLNIFLTGIGVISL